MNETLRTIASRYSCRDYQEQMPSDEALRLIAEAAVQAPSGMNRQAWRVVVVKDRELMRDMEQEGMAYITAMEDRFLYNRIMNRGGRLFYGAPCMIVVPVDAAQGNLIEIDCGILCQNITLAAASLGLASVICGFASLAFASGRRAAEFAERLRFPAGYRLGCAVLLGYANTAGKPHTPDLGKIILIE